MLAKHSTHKGSWIIWALIILLFFWVIFKGIVYRPRYYYDYYFPECGWY